MELTPDHCLTSRIPLIHQYVPTMWDADGRGLTLDMRRSYREGVMQHQILVVLGRRVVA